MAYILSTRNLGGDRYKVLSLNGDQLEVHKCRGSKLPDSDDSHKYSDKLKLTKFGSHVEMGDLVSGDFDGNKITYSKGDKRLRSVLNKFYDVHEDTKFN